MDKRLKQSIKLFLFFKNWHIRFLEILKLLPKKLIKLKTRDDLNFYIRPYSSDSTYLQSIAMDGEYSRYFKIFSGDTIIDIGANIGSFSVSEAHHEPNAFFYAIEPLRKNFDLLVKNVKVNNLKNIAIIHAGVSDKEKILKFYHGKNSLFGSGSLYKTNAIEENNKEYVRGITLANLFSQYQINKCDYLKMDCEGAEYKILFNTSDEILNKISKIAVEFHNFEPENNQYDLIDFLRAKGFRTLLPKKYETKNIGLIFAIK